MKKGFVSIFNKREISISIALISLRDALKYKGKNGIRVLAEAFKEIEEGKRNIR